MSATGRRCAGAALAVVVVAAVVLVARSTSGDPTLESASAADRRDQPAEGSPTVPQGPATELTGSGSPPGVADLCAGGPPEECRIDDTLANPPPDPPALPVLPGVRPGSLGAPALVDSADPFVLVDGQTYFVFSTSAEYLNVPVATIPAGALGPHPSGPGWAVMESSGLIRPDGRVARRDAMPDPPPWAVPHVGIWAPSVARMEGTYVMFFAAKRPDAPDPANQECVGRATSEAPQGPYVADPVPFTCGLGELHGALDPSVFRDRDGTLVLHVAFGGTSTPLWSIPLTGTGLAAGPPTPLLSMTQAWESWFLENPTMVFDGEHYLLAYSAGRWETASYSTGLARCASARGPCRSDPRGPWLASTGAVSGPGGLSFYTDVSGRLSAAYHAYSAGNEVRFGGRSTHLRTVRIDGAGVSLV